MLRYRDFVPEVTKTNFIGFITELTPFDLVVAKASAWIEENSVAVINLETVLLPATANSVRSPADHPLSMESSKWMQILRVWYQE